MRAVVQRVSRATVRQVSTGEVLGSLGSGSEAAGGLCVLLGVGQSDTRTEAAYLADKIAGLRIFSDPPSENEPQRPGNMNRSLREVGGALLVISQFTLYADTSRGRRPSFTQAMPPDPAQALYEYFVAVLREKGYRVETGRFGALMEVELVNDGPVTIWLDTGETGKSRDKTPQPAPAPAGQGG